MINYTEASNTEMREAIASRIRSERKALNKTQEEFAEIIGYSKPTIISWERKDGMNRIPDIDQLITLASVFDCEVGYLLCEYDAKTRNATDICQETGLSAEAVNALIENHSKAHADLIDRYIVKGGEISEAIERLREMQRSGNGNIKHYEFDVTDSFLDLVKEYIKQEDE